MASISEFVLRPFEGLPNEPDWVAMREIVPAATAHVRTTAEQGSRDVLVTTNLPMSWPALHRTDGVVLVALQAIAGTGDASRNVAAVLLEALAAEPGTSVTTTSSPGDGPRLQDVLDLTVPFEVTVHEGFEYWLASDTEVTPELRESLEEADATIVPTRKLAGVESAYWCRMAGREFVRWARAEDEQVVLDALARLHARRQSGIGASRFVGYFRTCGLVVPVWELPRGTEAADIEPEVQAFSTGFSAALADTTPLDANQRRARSGLVARQVTLR